MRIRLKKRTNFKTQIIKRTPKNIAVVHMAIKIKEINKNKKKHYNHTSKTNNKNVNKLFKNR